MIRQKTILVTEDLNTDDETHKRRGLLVRDFASKLAVKMNYKLQLFHAVEALTLAPTLSDAERAAHPLITQAETTLKGLVEKLEPKSTTRVHQGRAIAGILKELQTHSYEYIIQGSQAARGLHRVIVGSVAEEVIRQSKIPVITFGPEVETIEIPDSPKILVATDLGKTSKAAVDLAVHLASELNAEIVLVHCPYRGNESGLRSAIGVPYTPIFSEALYQKEVDEARQILDVITKEILEKGIRCRSKFRDDQLFAEDALLSEIQKEKPTLLVMGTHSRNLFSAFYFGSTTRRMILTSPVPVVTVKSI